MKKLLKRSIVALALVLAMIAAVGIAVAAATEKDVASFEISVAEKVAEYKKANPNAANHTISKNHKIVYADSAYFIDSVNGTGNYFEYYAKTGADAIKAKLSALGVRASVVSDAKNEASKEILVGIVDRSAATELIHEIDVNEFIIKVTDKNIILLAWTDYVLEMCVEGFLECLTSSSPSWPVGFEFVGVADEDWRVDFARPEDTTLTAGQYVNDEAIQFVYTGDGATNEGYKSYCEKLVADGFSLVWRNTVGNNEFRMYKNSEKETALYVAYNDYTYGDDIKATDALPGDFVKCIRIVSSPLSAILLPDDANNTFGTPQDYTKITDSYLVTLGISSGNVGSGHIVMLEDGSFIVVDGGNCKTNGTVCADGTWCSHSALIWDSLVSLYKKAHGHEPTAEEPIRISAWYLTHAHDDHYRAFYHMVKYIDADATKRELFKVDYIIANLPGENSLSQGSSATWGFKGGFDKMKGLLGGIDFIKVHTGQKLYFANLMIEVMSTFEDHLPFLINNSNDSNTVTRFHIGSTDNGEAGETTTVMFIGDSWRPTSRFLCAMYGKYLKSDITQVAHHGNIGSEAALYDLIAPTGVLFNNTLSMFKQYGWSKYTGSNPETKHAYEVDKYVVKSLKSVKYVWNAVEGKTPTIQITAYGALYDEAFDLANGKALNYIDYTISIIKQTGFIKKASVVIHEHSYALVSVNEMHHQYECECGSVINYSAHVTEPDDNDCTTPTICNECGDITVEEKAHELDEDGKCKNCAYVEVIETTPVTTDKKGCGGTIALTGIALIASLGAGAVFVEKKRR